MSSPEPIISDTQIASAASTEIIIQLTEMNKWFGQFHVLQDIDLTVYKGERIVICGPSGSGKSTLIRCMNRLEPRPAKHPESDREFFRSHHGTTAVRTI